MENVMPPKIIPVRWQVRFPDELGGQDGEVVALKAHDDAVENAIERERVSIINKAELGARILYLQNEPVENHGGDWRQWTDSQKDFYMEQSRNLLGVVVNDEAFSFWEGGEDIR